MVHGRAGECIKVAVKEKHPKLTVKQEAFARAVALKRMTYSDAYRVAYNTKTENGMTVWGNAYKIRSLTKVATRISELQERSTERLLMSKQQYLEKLERMTMADVRTIFDPVGGVKEVQEIGDAEADCIEGIEVVENFAKVGDKAEHVGYTKKIKLTSKRALLKDYGEARGWLEGVPDAGTRRMILRKYVQQEVHIHEATSTYNGDGPIVDVASNGHGPGHLQQINGRPDSGSEGAEDE